MLHVTYFVLHLTHFVSVGQNVKRNCIKEKIERHYIFSLTLWSIKLTLASQQMLILQNIHLIFYLNGPLTSHQLIQNCFGWYLIFYFNINRMWFKLTIDSNKTGVNIDLFLLIWNNKTDKRLCTWGVHSVQVVSLKLQSCSRFMQSSLTLNYDVHYLSRYLCFQLLYPWLHLISQSF